MKHLICLTIFLVVTAAISVARAGGQERRACEFEVKARCESGDVRVTLAGGIVNRVEVNVVQCGLPGRPGYSCTIDSSRGDGESKWSIEGGATVIANTSPFNPDQPDQFKVTVGRHVSIGFEDTQSLGRCGAGAELPRAIVLPAQGRACRVWLGSR
jgi:hypothetical protein